MTATGVRVVDASALAAVLFEEPAAGLVAEQLNNVALAAPQLLTYEIANICLKKMRGHPDQRDVLLTQFLSYLAMSIDIHEVDLLATLEPAERFNLTAYDASYLWLARELGAELVTLDRQLARAAASLSQT